MRCSRALVSFCLVWALSPIFAQTESSSIIAPSAETDYAPAYCDVQWTFTAEALWLQRGNSAPLVTAEPTVGPPVATAYAGDQFRPGVRFDLWRFGEDGNAWEASYFGLNQWAEDETVLGDPVGFTFLAFSPALRFDDIIGGFDTSIAFNYRAETHSAEINRWRLWTANDDWTVQAMAGARYFTFSERLSMVGTDATFGSETFDAAASNHLVGGQAGLRVDRNFDRLNIYGIGKAGLYGNFWSNRLDDVVVANVGFPPPNVSISNRGTGVAGLFELQVGSSYRLTDYASVISSYNFYYVPGVTLQPTTGGGNPNHSDGLVLHGGTIGLLLNW